MDAAHATTRSERLVVMLLCLLGALHVFYFCAAFPFFNVSDEQVHFDLAVRYSHGDIPRTLSPPCPEALPFIAIYGTPEYLWPPATQTGGDIPPPPWKQPIETVRDQLQAKEAGYNAHFKNHEAGSPPLYYALAGAWWKLGHGLKLDGAQRLYWLRFLNVPLVVLLMVLGWFTAREVFPDRIFIRLAVATLIGALPQTAFYSIGNDVLTPLTFGLVFLALIKFWNAEGLTPGLVFLLGFSLAGAYLTKTSNVPLIAIAMLCVVLRIFIWAKQDNLPESPTPFYLLFATAAVPILIWMVWCKIHFGDLTGSNLKIQFLGWTVKPISEWGQHPLFTKHGCWFFITQNLATFWQGETLWDRQPLALPGVDATYIVLTLGTLALTLAGLVIPPSPYASTQRPALAFAFLCVFSMFVFYAWLSVRYDFHDCFYPSTAHPYFVSGRLMLGMLIPVLLLFACGLDRLMNRFDGSTKFSMMLALIGFMIGSELTIDGPIISDNYNWFHL